MDGPGLRRREALKTAARVDVMARTIDYWNLPKKHEGFIPRELPPMSTVEIEPEPEEPNGGRSRKLDQKREQGQERRFFD